MPSENWRFGGGLSETTLHPFALVAMFVAIILILVLPRKYVVMVFLLSAFLIPLSQEIVVARVHLFVFRILILFGWVRILWMKLSSQTNIISGGFNSLDKAFTLWAICRASAFMLLYQEKGAVIYQCGFLWDVFGTYFLLRFLVRNYRDIYRVLTAFAVVAAIVAVGMLNEKLRSQNLFRLLGGLPVVPSIRWGSIRAQGPFAHAILAGTFGATLLPLFLWLWKSGEARLLCMIGVIGSTVITLTSASSTPLVAYAAGIVAILFWPLRKQMQPFRWGIAIALVGLQLVMKAPVWFLITRANLVSSSSGYHRAMLVDQFVRHFGDWWLLGTNANQNWGFEMWDLSNQFVAEGQTGGLATLVCFIAMISISFGRIGAARKTIEGDSKKEWFLWLLGAALFAHIVGFFGISYFDQTKISWLALLAMISAATGPILATKAFSWHQAGIASTNLRLAYPRSSLSRSTARGLLPGLRKRFNFRPVPSGRKQGF